MKIITNFTNTRKERTKIHWGNVIAGTITILGFLIVLYFLGVGTGITNKGTELNPLVLTDTFIWLLLSTILAVFTGGFLAAITRGSTSKIDGGLHGFLAWALSIVLLWIFFSVTESFLYVAITNKASMLLFWVLIIGALVGLCGGLIAASSLFTSEELEKSFSS